jgi:hypothetical protein
MGKREIHKFGFYTVICTYRPTELDSEGCDGIYVESVHIKWWGYPVIFIQWIIERIFGWEKG